MRLDKPRGGKLAVPEIHLSGYGVYGIYASSWLELF
jgi:hypothetical protein